MATPQRFLLLVTQADLGGVQSFLVRFAAQLQKEGHAVLLAGGGEGELWAKAAEQNVPTRKLKHVVREINPVQDIKGWLEVRRLIKEYKPDAIHLNSTKMGILGSLAACKIKTRVVYRIGGWVFLEPLPGLKKWIYLQAEKITAKCKDIIICVHPGDAKLAQELGIKPRQEIRVVPNGLPENFSAGLLSREEARKILSLPEEAFVFGTVANAYPTKGLLPYLDALKPVHDERQDSNFIILGDGPEMENLKNKKQSLHLERLNLPGQIKNATQLYRAFDVFVLPSVKEGMPWTLLEAMSAGVPIIATDVGANKWMTTSFADCGPAALVIPSRNKSSLTEALKKIMAPEMRTALGQAGIKITQTHFNWQRTYAGNLDALNVRHII